MATLLSELVRVLSAAAGRELRQRADGPALSRAEIMALATLSDLATACLTTGEGPATGDNCVDWDVLLELASHDFQVIDIAKTLAPARTS